MQSSAKSVYSRSQPPPASLKNTPLTTHTLLQQTSQRDGHQLKEKLDTPIIIHPATTTWYAASNGIQF